ncbi:hypothetical protein D3C71_259220 [compost metagenome]
MSEQTLSFSHTARNMMVSLNDGTPDTSLEEIEKKVRSIVELPDARLIDGYANVFFAVDDEYLVIFERQGASVLIRSIADAAGYPGLVAQR